MNCPTCGGEPAAYTLSTSGKVLYLCGNKHCPQGSYFEDTKPKLTQKKVSRRAKASYLSAKPTS
jgi:hypothetical protein